MITLAQFRSHLEQFRGRPFNSRQWTVIRAAANASLHIVAGPGTGKTTSLVARILKLIFVDALTPGSILATTFTKKAAEELRSRILSQGIGLKRRIANDPAISVVAKAWARDVDVNQVLTGTIDSICQEILRQFKVPGAPDPEPIDDFVASTLMFRDGLLFSGNVSNADLRSFLLPLHGPNPYGFTAGRQSGIIEEIYQRWRNDDIDFTAFRSSGSASERAAKGVIAQVIQRYENRLDEIGGIDFAQMTKRVLEMFRAAGALDSWRDQIRVLIVDEYQDTNLLQEQLYFEIARANGVICVVGDDDQSLYRFRGATVDLFTNFPARLNTQLAINPVTRFLNDNYRSAAPIVALANRYAVLDTSYRAIRVPNKPAIVGQASFPQTFPVLGIFRDTPELLADALAQFIFDVFSGNGRTIPNAGTLIADPASGDLGDCCLLCSSPREMTAADPPRVRLPRLLRDRLRAFAPPIEIFNPKGQNIADVPLVRIFGGYIARVIDPSNIHLLTSGVGRYDARTTATINGWQAAATAHYNDPTTDPELIPFVDGWINRTAAPGRVWPESVSMLEFLNGLFHFFPELHDDPEQHLYYEVFARQFQACQRIGSFEGDLVYAPSNPDRERRAAHQLIELFVAPIASAAVGVNEELIETFPRNRLSVMSIHQAKGLEFPMVIVDIGSDFKINSPSQRRDRFPDDGETCHRLETMMRRYSSGLSRPTRTDRDRAFDDLFRKFFVAYSRPEQCLVLVGLNKTRPTAPSIPCVASGYSRAGVPSWPSAVPIQFL